MLTLQEPGDDNKHDWHDWFLTQEQAIELNLNLSRSLAVNAAETAEESGPA